MNTNAFLSLVESFPIGKAKKLTYLVYPVRPDFSLRSWNYKLPSNLNGIPKPLSLQITTLFFFFLSSATQQVVVTSRVEENYSS